MKPIVVVGSINMDLVSRASHIPRPGETVLGTNFQMHSGGKGANQAVAVARLGHPCILLGKVGNDVFGQQLLSVLRQYGVDTSHVDVIPGISGTASIVVEDSGENSIVVTPGANFSATPSYLQEKLDILKTAGIVLAQLKIPLESIEWLAQTCLSIEVPLLLDPAPARMLPPSLLSCVEWFTPNETEAAFFAQGAGSDEAILSELFRMGARHIILKRGASGALLCTSPEEVCWISSFPVEAIDSTAAGDTFNGAFAVALMRGQTPVEGIRFAAAAAALSVTRHGAQQSMPNQQEVDSFLKSML